MTAGGTLPSMDLLAWLSLPLTQASDQLLLLTPQQLEALRTNLWDILGTVGRKEEFVALQRVLATKSDLTIEMLSTLPLPFGKILVAVRTGIQAFLHPSVQINQQNLAEIFLQRRCKNMACQSPLPAGTCTCVTCSRPGFCNLCMCVVCKKFDFETNTCRWIGCDFCLHWCHSECAVQMGHIRAVSSAKTTKEGGNPNSESPDGREDMAYCCPPCDHGSDLIGFVKDVFDMCSGQWDGRVTRSELECVWALFTGSTTVKGVQLLHYVTRLLASLDQGMDARVALQDFKTFLGSDPMCPSPSMSARTSCAPEANSPPLRGQGTVVSLPGGPGAALTPTPTPPPTAPGAAGPHFSTGLALGMPGTGPGGAPSPSMPLGVPSEGDAPSRGRSWGTGVGEKRTQRADVIFLDEDGPATALEAMERDLAQRRQELALAEEERRKVERQITELQNVADSREADAKRLEAEAAEARKEVEVLANIIQVKKRTADRDFQGRRNSIQLEEAEDKRRKLLEAVERMKREEGEGAEGHR